MTMGGGPRVFADVSYMPAYGWQFFITGEDAYGKILGRHRSTGIARPHFWERAQYFREENRLAQALADAEVLDDNGNPMGDHNGA